MGRPAAPSPLLRFGPFELEVRSCVLRRAGKSLALQPQPARILAFLASRPGEIVTREELRLEIWGRSTFVDFEHNLNFSVRQIRTVLRDNARKPRFIETLPRRGYRFVAAVTEAVPHAINAIAVLPLENLSDDPEQEYFADGATDELITALAKIEALRVISRTSVQLYKRARRPLPEIARKLNVDAVVEGTVFRSGSRIRVTAQLIDARREAHLWAESYERDLGDVLKLQAEIAQAIAGQIRVRITADDHSRLRSVRRLDPEAHEAYLKGRYFWNKRTEHTLQRAQEYFSMAIDKDPGYALAYTGLADTYFYRGYIFGRMDPRDAMPEARAAALRALELDPTLGEAHVSLALVYWFFDWDWESAEREFDTAMRLNSGYATAHHVYGAFLSSSGRPQDAILEAQRGLAIDPLSIPINNILGEIYMFAGEWRRALEQFRQTVELDPNVWLLHENLGIVLEELGRPDEAGREYLKACTLSGTDAATIAMLDDAHRQSGLRGFRRKQLELDLQRADGWHVDTFRIAANYARLGDTDQALEWLERASAARSGWMVWIHAYPYFRKIRYHPRFRNLVQRVGLPGECRP